MTAAVGQEPQPPIRQLLVDNGHYCRTQTRCNVPTMPTSVALAVAVTYCVDDQVRGTAPFVPPGDLRPALAACPSNNVSLDVLPFVATPASIVFVAVVAAVVMLRYAFMMIRS